VSGDFPPRSPTRRRTAVTWGLCILWLLLIGFGVVSAVGPAWLKRISQPGKDVEATACKEYGDNSLRSGNLGLAVAQYQKALSIKPNLVSAAVNLAIAFDRLGQLPQADQILRYALKTQTLQKGVIYFHLAAIAEERKNIPEAIELYKQAFGTEFPPQIVHARLGNLYVRGQRFDEARREFETALNIQEDPTSFYRDMLRASLALFEEDTTHLPVIQAALARDVRLQDMTPYDLEIIRQMQNQNPDVSNAHANLAIVLAQLGDLARAQAHMERALEIWPENATARKNLEVLRQMRSQLSSPPP
jgi:tetratricopeptide (TPR) repeat protein